MLGKPHVALLGAMDAAFKGSWVVQGLVLCFHFLPMDLGLAIKANKWSRKRNPSYLGTIARV